eukprot:479510-Prymnesium_polylepis.1
MRTPVSSTYARTPEPVALPPHTASGCKPEREEAEDERVVSSASLLSSGSCTDITQSTSTRSTAGSARIVSSVTWLARTAAPFTADENVLTTEKSLVAPPERVLAARYPWVQSVAGTPVPVPEAVRDAVVCSACLLSVTRYWPATAVGQLASEIERAEFFWSNVDSPSACDSNANIEAMTCEPRPCAGPRRTLAATATPSTAPARKTPPIPCTRVESFME